MIEWQKKLKRAARQLELILMMRVNLIKYGGKTDGQKTRDTNTEY